ncbi:MAG: VWA domain-containing protein [Lentisphaeria bacterium]|nr:VWA domain-containing protein [Lentisphaeria bacterium]
MMFGFADPWQFLWTLSLLVLTAIYLWWRKSAIYTTSALFLWDSPLAAPKSGRKLKVAKLPLSFYLESLILMALILALAAPYWLRSSELPPLAVIMDNSFSMGQKLQNGCTAREAAIEALEKILRQNSRRRVLYFTAGRSTKLLYDGNEKFDFAAEWRADEGESNLMEAVTQVRNLNDECEIMVFSDHGDAADFGLDVGFYAVGENNGNVALVNARLNEEKLLLEVENFSDTAKEVTVNLSGGYSGSSALNLAAGERRKLIYQIKKITSPLLVELMSDGDALAADNFITLLPENKTPVKFALSAELTREMRRDLLRVLNDNPDYIPAVGGETVELFFTTSQNTSGESNFIWLPTTPAAANLTMERLQGAPESEIMAGVGLDDLQLAVDPSARMPGRILLRRGDEVIFSAQKKHNGKYDFYLNAEPTQSNFASTAAWPILFYNIAEALRRIRPGLDYANWRLGEVIEFRSGNAADSGGRILTLKLPNGGKREINITSQRAFLADLPGGITKLTDGEEEYLLAVQNCSRAESDLSGSIRVYRPAELRQSKSLQYRKSLVFAAILLALVILLMHNQALGRRRGDLK